MVPSASLVFLPLILLLSNSLATPQRMLFQNQIMSFASVKSLTTHRSFPTLVLLSNFIPSFLPHQTICSSSNFPLSPGAFVPSLVQFCPLGTPRLHRAKVPACLHARLWWFPPADFPGARAPVLELGASCLYRPPCTFLFIFSSQEQNIFSLTCLF